MTLTDPCVWCGKRYPVGVRGYQIDRRDGRVYAPVCERCYNAFGVSMTARQRGFRGLRHFRSAQGPQKPPPAQLPLSSDPERRRRRSMRQSPRKEDVRLLRAYRRRQGKIGRLPPVVPEDWPGPTVEHWTPAPMSRFDPCLAPVRGDDWMDDQLAGIIAGRVQSGGF